MLYPPILVSPSVNFWSQTVNILFETKCLFGEVISKGSYDFSEWQVLVPTSIHLMYWRIALLKKLKKITPTSSAFILPQANTQLNWLTIWIPLYRTMSKKNCISFVELYLQLRHDKWFKKTFSEHCNANLLSLTQTLLSLSLELTQALLPVVQNAPETIDAIWQATLTQLSSLTRNMLSDEIKFIWSICKKELISYQMMIKYFRDMLAIVTMPIPPLIWISSVKLNTIESILLTVYSKYATVQPIILDWSSSSTSRLYQRVWPEIIDISVVPMSVVKIPDNLVAPLLSITNIKLCSVNNFENVAMQGAQTILDWLQEGKTRIAIVAQDYISACRLTVLLKRAKILVADEIGCKVSTTQAATTLITLFDVLLKQSNTVALLDFLKLPFVLASVTNKITYIMQIESQLRQRKIFGVWRNVFMSLDMPLTIYNYLQKLALQTVICDIPKTITSWSNTIQKQLKILDIYNFFKKDDAGQQILLLLESLSTDIKSNDTNEMFSFLEWRTFLDFQLNTTTFLPLIRNHHVVMLSLNNIRLRYFDAVLVVGIDAEHFPMRLQETLFFSKMIRHQLGLSTQTSLQCQELRDLIELFCTNSEIVLIWQTHKENGELNLLSPTLERLQLYLAKTGVEQLSEHKCILPVRHLLRLPLVMPTPVASELLPLKLSVTAYRSLMSCPYQFFVLYMLQIIVMDQLLCAPTKRNYGNWLHKILAKYHSVVRDHNIPLEKRSDILKKISNTVFSTVIVEHPITLGYIVRWQKIIPAYLLWTNQREQKGWYFAFSEISMQHKLILPGGTSIKLYGQLDRIDKNDAGEQVVLDYKVQNLPTLIARLKDSKEDYQLAFYGLLSQKKFSAAHYVALEAYQTRINDVAVLDFQKQQQELQQQIIMIMTAIAQGVSLPANGIESVCQYCKVRGLCRKGAW